MAVALIPLGWEALAYAFGAIAASILLAKTAEEVISQKKKGSIRGEFPEGHINFLKKCKQLNLIPKGLRIKNITGLTKNRALIDKTMEKIRNNLLESRYKQQRLNTIELNTQLNILNIYIEDCQPDRNIKFDTTWINKHDRNQKTILIKKHERKLETLITNNSNNNYRATSKIDTSNVVNESNVVLSDECLNVLSKGLKFIPTPLYINTVEVISNVEKSLSYVPLPFKRSAIAEISTFMLKWKKSQKSNMTKKELESLHELRRNNDIVIVPADKGGKIVVMNKCNYINKVEEKLNNVDLYEQVKDPTDTIKKKLSELTMRMFKNNKINAIQKLELMSIDNLAVIQH
ncbi:unnamed protein product [Rotaria sordida]|uniref:Uncharacterized protein n=2 Tax=Rotaria sordida TaxID=392033 RepID=A0A815PJS5_9BILA|nr:unnamed protein product [Rotaria sordida]